MRQKNNIPAVTGLFLRTEIDLKDFKNENLTTKIRKNQEEKPCFLKKVFQKILKQMEPSNKINS